MWSAPCESNCPLGVRIPDFIELVTHKLYKEAAILIKEATFPLSGTLAYICAHPCEDNCRYITSKINSNIVIHELKRFLMDNYFTCWIPKIKEDIGKRREVCVVGSGPAGLYATYLLSSYNFRVTLYELESELGGMLNYAIPYYRLPESVMKRDIEELLLSFPEINVKTNYKVENIEDLAEEYAGVILACGLIESKDLPTLEGRDLEGVDLALPFLREAKKNPKVYSNEAIEMIVIGGGNVAVDVARTAIRLGATKVKVVALEKYEELPAFPWELRGAEEEGVEFICGVGPNKLLGKDKVEGLEVVEVKSIFDEEGNFSPTFYPDRKSIILGNRVVIAIGQKYPKDLLDSLKIRVDLKIPQVNKEGVFLAGDIVEGPTNVARAMKSAKEAVYKLLNYLDAKKVEVEKRLVPIESFEESTAKRLLSLRELPKLDIPHINPEKRRKNFYFVETELNLPDVYREAARCLSCAQIQLKEEYQDNCSYCSICVYLCPQEAIYWEKNRLFQNLGKCLSCGLCLSVCPQKNFYPLSSFYSSLIFKLVSESKGKTIAFKCIRGKDIESSSFHINISCFSKISTSLLLFCYTTGKKEVILLDNCKEECYLFHPKVSTHIKEKVKEVEELISSICELKISYVS